MCLRAPVLREVRATWIIEMRGEGTKRPTGRFRGGCNCCDSVWKRKTVQISGEICSQTRRNPQSTDRHHRVDAISAPAAISTLYLFAIGLPVCLTLAHVSELTRRRRGHCRTCRLDFIYMYFYTRRCLHSSTAAAAEGGCYDAQCVTVISVDSIIWAVLCSPDGDWLLMCTEPVGVNAALSSASAASIDATHACCDRDILRLMPLVCHW